MNGREGGATRPVVAAAVLAVVVTAAVVAFYASWLSGVRSFSSTALFGTAVPAVLLLALSLPSPRAHRGYDRRTAVRHALPFLLLLVVAAGLEGAGLAMGGHSPVVPTLSTVADHALAWRATRALLVVLWLAVGFGPALFRLRHRHSQLRPGASSGSPP